MGCLVQLQTWVSRLWKGLKSSLPCLVMGLYDLKAGTGRSSLLSTWLLGLHYSRAVSGESDFYLRSGFLHSKCRGTGSGSCQPLKTKTLKLTQHHFHYWIRNQSCADTRERELTFRFLETKAKEFVATLNPSHSPTRTQDSKSLFIVGHYPSLTS